MEKDISSLTGLIKNNKYIVPDINTWLLIEFDIQSGIYHIITDLLQKKQEDIFFCIKMLEVDESIFLIYRNSKRIIEYNSVTQKLYRYGAEYEIYNHSVILYSDAYLFGDKIIMLPYDVDSSIVAFDVRTKKYVEKESLKTLFAKIGIEIYAGLIFTYVHRKNKVWFCINESGWIGCLDLKNISLNAWQCSRTSRLFMSTGGLDAVFFSEVGSHRFFMLNDLENDLLLYDAYDLKLKDEEGGYRVIVSYGNRIIAVPERAQSISVINKKTKRVQNIAFPKEFCIIPQIRKIPMPFARYILELNKLYLIPFSCNGMLIVDIDSGNISYCPMRISNRDVVRVNYKRAAVSLTYERDGFNIKDFIYVVDKVENLDELFEKKPNSVGKQIYQKLI